MKGDTAEQYKVEVSAKGQLVLPSALRQQLHVEGGGFLIIREEAGRLMIEGTDDAVRRAQAIGRRHAPDAQGVVDELIAERRAEAGRE